jgi:electron transfer flavoprotein alpha subunit
MRDIIVYIERSQGLPEGLTRPLLAKAAEMAKVLGGKTIAVLLSSQLSTPLESGIEADEIYIGDHPSLEWYNPEIHGRIVADLHRRIRPAITLVGHSYAGMDLGNVIAASAGIPFISNCFDLEIVGGEIFVMRPCYRGKVHSRVSISKSLPCVISMGKGFKSASEEGPARAPETHRLEIEVDQQSLRQRVLEVKTVQSSGTDISKAAVIVSVGRGIGDKTNIEMAKELATTLGGALGCSRPLVDIGWLPQEHQIGLSGRTVAPRLYIACGISGCIEHQVGMIGSEVIVAINNDPSAPIFDIAKYGIVGDALRVVPAFTRAVVDVYKRSGGQR